MLTRGVFLERTVVNGAKRSGAQREEGGLEFLFCFPLLLCGCRCFSCYACRAINMYQCIHAWWYVPGCHNVGMMSWLYVCVWLFPFMVGCVDLMMMRTMMIFSH